MSTPARARPDRELPFAKGLSSLDFTERAPAIAAGSLTLAPHDAVDLTDPPDWTFDPFDDPNWRYQFHALRWSQMLKRAHDESGDPAFLVRYLGILEDWHAHNPWEAPSSEAAWGDHATAIRARVYAACGQALADHRDGERLPRWLRLALDEHVDVLSGPDLYPSGGNHALNQNVGLFCAASILGRQTAQRFAIDRTAALLERSVDEEGVTDEQSTEYQVYNFRRYREAAELFAAEVGALPDVFARIPRMTALIADACLPNGHDAMVGDACNELSYATKPGFIVGGVDLAATEPTSRSAEDARQSANPAHSKPHALVSVYQRGFLFARSTTDGHLTARFGAARIPHGHHDAGAIAWFSRGRRVLSNAGKYAYRNDEFRDYVLSRAAQNSVSFTDVAYGPDGGSVLEFSEVHADDTLFVAQIRDLHYPDVDLVRALIWNLSGDRLIVIDRFEHLDARPVNAEQRFRFDPAFHLAIVPTSTGDREAQQPVASSPRTCQGTVDTPSGTQTLDIVHHTPTDNMAVRCGQTGPLEGWVSYQYGEQTPSPVLRTRRHARRGLFVTEFAWRTHDRDLSVASRATDALAPTGPPASMSIDHDRLTVEIAGKQLPER